MVVPQLIASCLAGQVEDSHRAPSAVVRQLYREVVARHPLGIPNEANMKIFAPFLSEVLLHRIDLAIACSADWYRQNPDPNLKPPFAWLEAGLFSGDDEQALPRAFQIEGTQSEKDGSSHVRVRLTWGSATHPWIWHVEAIVVRENARFVVDDVVYLKDEDRDVDSRLSEYLSAACDGSRWVGYVDSRYPNEVLGFRFFANSTLYDLKPLVSSMRDVRRVLGNPDEANDVSAYTKPYPGDEKVLKPVFKYKFGDDWQLLVYFTKYCFHEVPKGTPADRLCSLDLVPQKPIAFDVSKLSIAFARTHVKAVDAEWDAYSDGTGLEYDVYSTHTQYGPEKPGDLNRISYGPSKTSASAK